MSPEKNTSQCIMVADDEERNRRLLEAMLVPLGYKVVTASDGQDALDKIASSPPDLILLDVMMPKVGGLEVTRKLKANEKTKMIPVVIVTMLSGLEDRVKALEAGTDDFLGKPVDKSELIARVRSLLKVKAYNDHIKNYKRELEAEVAEKTERLNRAMAQLRESSLETIFRLARAAEFKDEETPSHVLRVRNYSASIARELGLKPEDVETMLYASCLHDIGKIATPDRILLKPGKLDEQEWEIMKKHSEFGAQILDKPSTDLVRVGKIIALSHHEKWDGGGYPDGLQGQQIPLEGRIVAVADVFDALTSKRPYKEPFPVDKSLEIIRKAASSHFDPEVVKAFFSIKHEILSIREKYKDISPSKFLGVHLN